MEKNRLDDALRSVFTLWFNPQLPSFVDTAKNFKDKSKLRIGYYNQVAIYLVNGDIIKTSCFPDFVEGGNDAVYGTSNGEVAKFMPENEIWLDANLDINSLPYICFHEIWERQHMLEEKLDYQAAHDKANTLEMKLREIKAFEDFPKESPSEKME